MMLDSLFNCFLSYQGRRKRLLKKVPAGPLQSYLSVPFPDPNTPINQVPILAMDFETTGLQVKRDQILSIGHIEVVNFEINLASAFHQIICTRGQLHEDGVIIHHITDDIKQHGQSIEEVLPQLLQAMAGKIILVHFAHIEKHFLQHACRRLYGYAPDFPIIDSLVLARKRLDQKTALYSPNDLRLFNLREAHQLPRYKAHNALSDALATAELFFAEVEAKGQRKPPLLKQLLL